MRHTPTPIPARQASEHDRLVADLDSLLADLATLRGNDAVADGMLLVLARRLMADTARLVSREPGTSQMKRLPAGGPLPVPLVRDTLRDARLALRAFQHAHCWIRPGSGSILWCTHEAMAPRHD